MDNIEDPQASVDWKLVAENLQAENSELRKAQNDLAMRMDQVTAIVQRQAQQMEGMLQALDRTLLFSHKLVLGKGPQNG